MKRHFLILFISILFTVAIVGCSVSEDPADDANNDQTTNIENQETEQREGQEEDGNFTIESELGRHSEISYAGELDDEGESGPVNIKVHGYVINEVKIAEDNQAMVGNKKEGTLVAFLLEINNSSDDEVYFFTNEAMLETNTGEVVAADKMLSELVGDPLMGGAVREGDITFLLDTKAEDIHEVKLTFLSTENVENEALGDPIEFRFDVNED